LTFFYAESRTNGCPRTGRLTNLPSSHAPKKHADLNHSDWQALSHIHVKGVTHNDVRLENCVLDAEGEVRLGDFSRSQFRANAADGERTRFVTAHQYMAPEVLARSRGRGASAPADVWAFAVAWYRLLTGKAPFRSGSLAELMADMASEPWKPALRKLGIGVLALFERLFAENPAKRPTSSELLQSRWFAHDSPPPTVVAAVAAAAQSGLPIFQGSSAPDAVTGATAVAARARGVGSGKKGKVFSEAFANELARMDQLLATARERYNRKCQRRSLAQAKENTARLAQDFRRSSSTSALRLDATRPSSGTAASAMGGHEYGHKPMSGSVSASAVESALWPGDLLKEARQARLKIRAAIDTVGPTRPTSAPSSTSSSTTPTPTNGALKLGRRKKTPLRRSQTANGGAGGKKKRLLRIGSDSESLAPTATARAEESGGTATVLPTIVPQSRTPRGWH
jgi:hypothetical protein